MLKSYEWSLLKTLLTTVTAFPIGIIYFLYSAYDLDYYLAEILRKNRLLFQDHLYLFLKN